MGYKGRNSQKSLLEERLNIAWARNVYKDFADLAKTKSCITALDRISLRLIRESKRKSQLVKKADAPDQFLT